MIEAVYLDGQTTKAHLVYVDLRIDTLNIYTNKKDTSPFAEWHLADCRTLNFNGSSNQMQIGYGEHPQKILELKSHSIEIKRELDQYKSSEKLVFGYALSAHPLKVITSGLLTLAVLIVVYVMYVSTFVGIAIVNIIPMSIEEDIGQRALNQYSILLNIDEEKSKVLNDFYKQTGFYSDYAIELFYDSSDMVNAFALPGGKIIVYKGLVDKMESWEELAALLSHELTHVNERHTLKIMSKQIGNYAVFSAITGDMAGISSVIIESAININEISYSRSFEKEADMKGLAMLVEHDITPTAMIDLFQRLLEENKKAEEFMEYLEMLSSHPLTQKRIEYIQETIENKSLSEYTGKPNFKAKELWSILKN